MDAEKYARLERRIRTHPIFGPAMADVLTRTGGLEGKRLLDLGCGQGELTPLFALAGAEVIGLDKRRKAIFQAIDRVRAFDVGSRCAFVVGRSETIPIADESFDIVFSRSTLQYCDIEKVLSECVRVLKPDGTLILVENLRDSPLINLYRALRRRNAKTEEQKKYLSSIRSYLTTDYCQKILGRFERTFHNEYHLLRIATMPLAFRFPRSAWALRVDRAFARLDEFLFARLPFLRRYAWITALVGGRKTAAGSARGAAPAQAPQPLYTGFFTLGFVDWLDVRHWRRLFAMLRADSKLTEMFSFLVWELMHRAGRLSYLRFSDRAAAINLDSTAIESVQNLDGCTLRLESAPSWKHVYFDSKGDSYGFLFYTRRDLVMTRANGETQIKSLNRAMRSLYVTAKGTLLLSLGRGGVARSDDGGANFVEVLALSQPQSYVLFDVGFAELPSGALLLGEYANIKTSAGFQSVAFLYSSTDDGKTWERSDFLLRDGVNKHVHFIKYVVNLDRLLLSDGDNKKQLWSGRVAREGAGLDGVEWTRHTRRHLDMGGYTAVAELGAEVVFGTDYNGGVNFIARGADLDHLDKLALPDPYRRGPIYRFVKRSGKAGEELWASVYSAIPGTRSLLMMTRDAANTWTRIIDYDGAKHRLELTSHSAEIARDLYFLLVGLDGDGHAQSARGFRISD